MRLTLGGGGTDDPRYVKENGGFALTAAITQHVYVGINDRFGDGYLLKYADVEDVQTIDEIKHPVLREALRFFDVPPSVEIISMADIPAGTGLGSSAAFTVGLCRTLATYMGGKLHKEDAAEVAAHIELDILGRSGGKQDHWACAMGGLLALEFRQNGHVHDGMCAISTQSVRELESRLCLFFTGYSRDADGILSTQTTNGLDKIKVIGYESERLLVEGNIRGFGELMNEHWRLKRNRSSEMSNSQIDSYYKIALANGAIGGKVVGAGGGGFLMFVTDNRVKLVAAMAAVGLRETPFRFDHDGSSIIANSK